MTELTVSDKLDTVPAERWNALATAGNPFLRHEFLVALERNGCVGEHSGWLPQHLLLEEDGCLAGAVATYAKLHSYGEFVFDWSWADAFERAGGRYYPKLVAAVPFTPAGGARLLVHPAFERERVAGTLLAGALALTRRLGASSLHWLFPHDADAALLERHGLMRRTGCQFHWQNPGYRDFDDFLSTLTSKRRKQIKRERREAAQAPVRVRVLDGHAAGEREWVAYHALYASTYDRKWGHPSLTPGFFREIGRTMPDSVLLVLAERADGRIVAGAHFLRGGGTLYGRNWGCSEYHRSLHFEMCYYRAMEHCIAAGIDRFEAGAQGEHKLLRGFLPVPTWSCHWIGHKGLRRAVADFLARERRGMDAYIAEMDAHSPFRCAPGAAPAPVA